MLAAMVIGFALAVFLDDDRGEARPGERQTRQAVSQTIRRCQAGEIGLGSRRASIVAFVPNRASVYRRPDGARVTTLERLSKSYVKTNRLGVPTVVAVLAEVRASDCRALWYRIRLPGRPGFSGAKEGYVRAGELEPAEIRTRVVVDLSRHSLTLFEDGNAILRAPAAVGAPATPTPRGRFLVRERIRVTDSGSAYGAAAVALSAFSEKLVDWPEGGPVAIHGTSDPGSIGRAVSHGCIRLGVGDLKRVFEKVQLGTPVEIVA